jgi:hypothetical protein
MSGPLASWSGRHYRPETKDGRPDVIARTVVKEYALAADAHGRPTYILTVTAIADRTGYSERAIYQGRRRAVDDQVLTEREHGGGHGIASRFEVSADCCPDPGCRECEALRKARRPKPDRPTRPDTSLHQVQGSRAENPAPHAKNPAPRAKNPARGANQTDNGSTAPPLGGAVLPPESNDRAPLRYAPRGSAAPSAVDGHPEPPGPSPTRPGAPATQPGRDGDPSLCKHEEGMPCTNHCKHRNCARDCWTCKAQREADAEREALA